MHSIETDQVVSGNGLWPCLCLFGSRVGVAVRVAAIKWHCRRIQYVGDGDRRVNAGFGLFVFARIRGVWAGRWTLLPDIGNHVGTFYWTC